MGMRTRIRRSDEERSARRVVTTLFGLALVGLGFGFQAPARDAARAIRHSGPRVHLLPREPSEFLRHLGPSRAVPVVALSQADAVVLELTKAERPLPMPVALRIAATVCDEGRDAGYDPLLILAVMRIESAYDHLAISPVGAEGLMQLMPLTAQSMAEELRVGWSDGSSFDPVLNVLLGTHYLGHLQQRFGRLDWALTAYNRGPAAVLRILREYGSLPPEIRDFYVSKVLRRYQRLRASYGRLPLC